MNIHTERFAKFCIACASDSYTVMALITNAIILGMLAAMLWALLP